MRTRIVPAAILAASLLAGISIARAAEAGPDKAKAIAVKRLPALSPRFKSWYGSGARGTWDVRPFTSQAARKLVAARRKYFKERGTKVEAEDERIFSSYLKARPGDLWIVTYEPGPTDQSVACMVDTGKQIVFDVAEPGP